MRCELTDDEWVPSTEVHDHILRIDPRNPRLAYLPWIAI